MELYWGRLEWPNESVSVLAWSAWFKYTVFHGYPKTRWGLVALVPLNPTQRRLLWPSFSYYGFNTRLRSWGYHRGLKLSRPKIS